MTKKTFEFSEFVRQAKSQWGSKFEYPEPKHFQMSGMITIVCREHGPFQQRPVSHLRGIGCKRCGRSKRAQPSKVRQIRKHSEGDVFLGTSFQDVLKEAPKFHPNVFYSEIIAPWAALLYIKAFSDIVNVAEKYPDRTKAKEAKSRFRSLLPMKYRWPAWGHLRGVKLSKFLQEVLGPFVETNTDLNPQIRLILSTLLRLNQVPYYCNSLIESVASGSDSNQSNVELLLEGWAPDLFGKRTSYAKKISALNSLLTKLADPKYDERVLVSGEVQGRLFLSVAQHIQTNVLSDPGEELWEMALVDPSNFYKNMFITHQNDDAHVLVSTYLMLGGRPIFDDYRTDSYTDRVLEIAAGQHTDSEQQYDCIVAVCPSGYLDGRDGTSKGRLEDRFVEYVMDSVAEGGRATIVVPDSFLYRERGAAKLRERLVEKFHLESVASLRGDIINAGPSSIMVFRRTEPNNKILFHSIPNVNDWDYTSLAGWTLTREEIAEQDWDLTAKPNNDVEYNKLLNEIVAAKQDIATATLGDVAEIFAGVRKDKKGSSKPTQMRPTVRIENIHLHKIHDRSVRREPVPTDFPTKRLLREGDILLSTRGTIGKVGLVHQHAKCIGGVARTNLTVIRAKEPMVAEYLYGLLKSGQVQIWLKDHARGELQNLKLKQLEKLPLPRIDDVSEQQVVAEVARTTDGDLIRTILARATNQGDPFVNWLITNNEVRNLSDKFYGMSLSEPEFSLEQLRKDIAAFIESFRQHETEQFVEWLDEHIERALQDGDAKTVDDTNRFSNRSFGWYVDVSKAIEPLAAISNAPEKLERYAILVSVGDTLNKWSVQNNSSNSLEKLFFLLQGTLQLYLGKEIEAIFSDTKIAITTDTHILFPSMEAPKSTEVPIEIHNESSMPIRSLELELTGPFTEDLLNIFSGKLKDKELLPAKIKSDKGMSFLNAGTSTGVIVSLPKPLAEVPVTSRQGLVAIICKWSGVRLDGKLIEGTSTVPLVVTFEFDRDEINGKSGGDPRVELRRMIKDFREHLPEALSAFDLATQSMTQLEADLESEVDEAHHLELAFTEAEAELAFEAAETRHLAEAFTEAEAELAFEDSEARHLREAFTEAEAELAFEDSEARHLREAFTETEAELAFEDSEARALESDGKDRPFELGQSPFNTGTHPEERPHMFLGREGVVRRIDGLLGGGNVVIVQGNRRIGKSSILKHVQIRKEQEGWVTPYIDFQEGDSVQLSEQRQAIELPEVFRLVALELGVSIYEKYGKEVPFPGQELVLGKERFREEFTTKSRETFRQDKPDAQSPYDILKAYIRRVLEVTRDTTILLVLDEFDMLQEGIDAGVTNAQVPSNLRALIQNNSTLCAIVAKYPDLQGKRKEYFHPFFALGQSLEVGPIGRDDAIELVTGSVADRLMYEPGTAGKVADVCGCRPYMIQCFCQDLFSAALYKKTHVITEDMVNEVIDDKQFMNTYFEDLFLLDSESARRRLILSIMARHRRTNTPLAASTNGQTASNPITYEELEGKLRESTVFYVEGSSDTLDEDLRILDKLEFLTEDLTGKASYRLTPPLWEFWIRRRNHEAIVRSAINESEMIMSNLESESLND